MYIFLDITEFLITQLAPSLVGALIFWTLWPGEEKGVLTELVATVTQTLTRPRCFIVYRYPLGEKWWVHYYRRIGTDRKFLPRRCRKFTDWVMNMKVCPTYVKRSNVGLTMKLGSSLEAPILAPALILGSKHQQRATSWIYIRFLVYLGQALYQVNMLKHFPFRVCGISK